jgi:UDP-N-acetylglucosamine--N-acetylmuramyl-(pentapeptide) pyrophosphoryl-undecaprenol N-acetylglucosamine transferase
VFPGRFLHRGQGDECGILFDIFGVILLRVVFTCGGTGGHINPAIAVAKLIRTKRPEAEILFAGADGGMEVGLVTREGFRIKTVPVSNFRRSFKPADIINNIKVLFGIRNSIKKAREILLDFEPDVVIGTGGYASFPTVYAASKLGIPTAIHESNAIPGLTTSLLSKRADRIMVGFDSADRYKNPEHVVLTGTPVREDFIFINRSDAKKRLGLEDKPLIVSTWGSLGAREMNKKIAEFIALETKSDQYYHIHATGRYGWRWMPDYVKNLGVDLSEHPNIDMREYIYDMPVVMAAADLVLCRGGASTLSEIIASATPAIIVPSPNVAENHQEMNARAIERHGGAIVLLEKECTGEKLYEMATEMLQDESLLESISSSLREIAVLDSAERIYSVICSLYKDKKKKT